MSKKAREMKKKSILQKMADELEMAIKQSEEHGASPESIKKSREVLETFRAHFELNKKHKPRNQNE